MSVGQCNDRKSCCPHYVKRDDRNMGEGTMVLLCRLGLLLVGERTISNSYLIVGQLGCASGGGEEGGSSSS